MTPKAFSKALSMIDGKYINEAIGYTAGRSRRWLKWGAAAACLCIVAAVAVIFSISHAPSQATDIYRTDSYVELADLDSLPAEYPGELLAGNLDLSDAQWYDVDLCYREPGTAESPEDWYSLLVSAGYEDYRMTMYCMFGQTSVEDWKVSMVFTDEATETVRINGTDVQIARRPLSLDYDYAYYAIFIHDGVVYDIRTQSNDEDCIHRVVRQILGE